MSPSRRNPLHSAGPGESELPTGTGLKLAIFVITFPAFDPTRDDCLTFMPKDPSPALHKTTSNSHNDGIGGSGVSGIGDLSGMAATGKGDKTEGEIVVLSAT